MKYFIDTEFLEGTQKGWFGKTTKPTIDLISVGIVCEDGREYYAISKDFNLKEAWSRSDWKQKKVNDGIPGAYKDYWIRDNVIKPIFIELRAKEVEEYNIAQRRNVVLNFPAYSFCFREFKRLIKKYGKTNKQIAEEILDFVNTNGSFVHKAYDKKQKNKVFDDVIENYGKPQFYGYYSDYDWVVFCWLFGRMIDLPKGFPMFAFDIQQQIEEYNIDKKLLLENIPQINCHNSLQDAIWNFKAYQYIQNKIENGGKRST